MAKTNSGLGRGLGALIPVAQVETGNVQKNEVGTPVETNSVPQPPVTPQAKKPIEDIISSVIENNNESADARDSVIEIAIDMIFPNPDQPRRNFKKEELEELSSSIEKTGLLQPITVRPLDGGYQIIAGERRWRASKMAGLEKVPVYIKTATDDEMLEFGLVENLQRADLNPIEAAIGYRRLMDKRGLTQVELAQLLSKGRSTIANTLRLLELPEDLQEMIYNNQLTEGHARAIQGVPTQEGRKNLADKVVEKQLSVRETENLARLMAGRVEGDSEEIVAAHATPNTYRLVARALKTKLNTNVKVKSVGGKNKIEIEFNDEEDLNRIYQMICGEE